MTKVICKWAAALVLLLAVVIPCSAQTAPAYKYFRVGNAADAQVKPQAGYALMGGGEDLDEAFQWLCARANGGDLLVLRATGTDAYNDYIQKLCHLNSEATVVIPNREAANDPFVAKTIRSASAIFIAGGDQANYLNFWERTPVQTALNDAIARGVPLGGTSAGLAVLGEYVYSAQGDKPNDPNLDAKTALHDPYSQRVTLARGFLDIPILKGVITDTHFAKRDRMGRLLVFLARLDEPDGKPVSPKATALRGVGVEQGVSVLLEPDGQASVVGKGCAYFIGLPESAGLIRRNAQLTFGLYAVQKVTSGHAFNLKTWTGDATRYSLSVKNGVVSSTQADGAIY
ncbi:cyanophycinase [Terracidiphilus gabretensis]|uniref:cyanophycinase n=1 Tax=Terracidiphilus gabretensis TaxID=1577687 RepID=UPI00071B2040|nr:cyanophycinase [Terracidiphilus gabretensis]